MKIDIKKPVINLASKVGIGRIEKVDIAPIEILQPESDPFAEVDFDGDLEQDIATETSVLLQGFKDRAKQEAERFELATDTEFWFAVGFKSREQKELFLQAMNWLQYGDKYLDGNRIARKAGISLPEVKLSNPTKRVDKKLIKLV